MKFSLLFALTAFIFCCHARDAVTVSLPDMIRKPVIDGTISQTEWKDSVHLQGLLTNNSPFMSSRQGGTWFGMDRDFLYLAASTELPPKGIPLLCRVKKRDGAVYLDDNMEFVICPDHGKFVYHIIVNSAGVIFDRKYPIVNGGTTPSDHKMWDPNIDVKSRTDAKNWTLELRIPLKAFERNRNSAPGTVWKILAARSWQHPWEQADICGADSYITPDDMAVMTWNPALPHVSYNGLGAQAGKGIFKIEFLVSNPGPAPRKVEHRISVSSDAAPRFQDSTVTIPPGGTVPVTLEFDESNASIARTLKAEFKDLATGTVIFRRSLAYDPALQNKRWTSPRQKNSAELEIGVYPYYKKVKARFGSPSEKVKGWDQAVFAILDSRGKILQHRRGIRSSYGFETEFSFEPVPGQYQVTVELLKGSQKKQAGKEFFKIEKFPWEHNQLGCERLIIPPYRPIRAEGPRQASVLMTGYRFKDGFFEQVQAGDCPNILASPIRLAINSKPLKETAFRFTEQSPDRFATETELRWDNGTILIKGVLDYDGFYRFTMNFRPDKKQQIRSAVITIPLKKEFARRIHSVCNRMRFNDARQLPAGPGIVWQSSQSEKTPLLQGNFRPYVWLGNMEKGLSWVCESDRHWSLDPARNALEVYSGPDSTELRIHLVNRNVEWEQPFAIEQAFQATPVRPLPDYRRRFTDRITFPNSWNLCTLAGSACWGSWHETLFYPLGKDYSFIEYLAARNFTPENNRKYVERYMTRYTGGFTAAQKNMLERHLKRGIIYTRHAKYIIPYLNARFSHMDWQDYHTYMDEWWCSEYRAKNADPYNNTPTRSYQDAALYYEQKLLRAGLHGIYYDNIRDYSNVNPVTGPAYRRKDGQMQPYFDIFNLREFVKRTAVMLCQEQKVFPDGRPILVLHMTNTNLIPVLSFGTVALDLEAEYGSKDFQDRFSEDYYKCCTLGLQSGAVPKTGTAITGKNRDFVTRTFLAISLAYDLPFFSNCGGVTKIWYDIWRKLYTWGYSTEKVQVFPCWTEETLDISNPGWRVTTYRKGKETLAAVSDFSNADGEGLLDAVSLNPVQAQDWETGEKLPIENGKVRIKIGRHDFRLIHLISK